MDIFEINELVVNTKTFTKGFEIYEKSNVLGIEIERDMYEGIDYVDALVKGSGSKKYIISIEYDFEEEELVSSSCECPAYASYDGLCKHCVAVLLEYSEKQGQDEDGFVDDYRDFPLKRDSYKNYQYQNHQQQVYQRGTDYEIKSLIKASSNHLVTPLFENKIQGEVKLEPTLHISYQGIYLTFRIGTTKLYVVQGVVEMANKIKNGEYHAYGKNLAFDHSIDAFEPLSIPLAKFLVKKIRTMKDYLYYGQSNRKQMMLEEMDLVELFNIVNEEILVNEGAGIKAYKVTREKLPRNLTIKATSEGVELLPDTFKGIMGERLNLYLHKNKLYLNTTEETEEIQEFLRAVANNRKKELFIANDDVKSFCHYLLPLLEKHYTVRRINFNESDYLVEEATFEMYLDLPEKNIIACKVFVYYGEKKRNLFTSHTVKVRDSVAEERVNKGVSKYFNEFDSESGELLLVHDEDKMYDLLSEGLELMKNYGTVYVSDRFKNINVSHFTSVKLGVSIESNLLELKFTGENLDMKLLGEVLHHYQAKKKYHRLKNGDFINVDDGEIEVLHQLFESMNLSVKDFKDNVLTLPKYRAIYIDEQLKKNHVLPSNRDKVFKSLISNMKTVEENDFDIPESLESILREYQKTGFLWMKTLAHNGFAGILADDMGLGKTLQVIAFLQSELEAATTKKTLIVCPSSLVYNWKSEFEKFSPKMDVITVTGSRDERKNLIENATDAKVLITSYDLLKRDLEYYQPIDFGYQIIDEAQFIKNHNTQAAKAVKSISSNYKLALTGTPIENRLSELWSIFDYLMPGFLYTYSKFKEKLEQPITLSQDSKATQRLSAMITPFVLRRLKADVLNDLPDKIEENVLIPIQGEQQKLYDAHVAKLRDDVKGQNDAEYKTSKIKVLAELTRLRQLCCDPKMVYENYSEMSAKVEACMGLIQEAVDGGHKILLFSQFTSMFPILQRHMDKSQISYFSLTGETSKEKRMKLVEDFNKDDTSVFCISLKAGGTGLNLASADIVIHFDPWWNVAVQNQASDRAHRIGQKNVVNVYKLIVKNSIEEKILKMQEAKQALADKMLSGENMSMASFTKEDLLNILGE